MSFLSVAATIRRGFNLIFGDTGAGDPFFVNVVLLAPFNGPNGTIIQTGDPTDFSTYHHLNDGNGPTYSNAQLRFGLNVIATNGSSVNNWGTNATAEFFMGVGDFTFEADWWQTAFGGGSGGYEVGGTGNPFGASNRWSIGSGRADVDFSRLSMYKDQDAVPFLQSGLGVLLAGVWNNVAYSRVSGVGFLFCNGNLVASGPDVTDWNSLQNNGINFPGNPANMNGPSGFIANVRLTKGVGRYTASYAPPTAPWPTS